MWFDQCHPVLWDIVLAWVLLVAASLLAWGLVVGVAWFVIRRVVNV